jgi:hypothetical protein
MFLFLEKKGRKLDDIPNPTFKKKKKKENKLSK